jgi:hypothetical protein
MAVIDQDNFSNISWHSEQNAAVGSMISPSHGPTSPELESNRRDVGIDRDLDDHRDFEAGNAGEILECTVSEPHKENDGTKDAYVSYLITTNVRFSADVTGLRVDVFSRHVTDRWANSYGFSFYLDHLPNLSEADSLSPEAVHRLCLPV